MPATESIVFTFFVFMLAGWVKGVVGMGLPAVAMGMLGLVMPPVQAVALVLVPSLVTNVWQFMSGLGWRVVARRLGLMLTFVVVGTALGIPLLTAGASRGPALALGIVLAVYAGVSLFMPKFHLSLRAERRLSPLVGVLTGMLAGATGISVVPSVPYLSALGFSKDELIQALGLTFMVSTVALAIGLGFSGDFSHGIVLASSAAMVPTMLGMAVGQRTRSRIDTDAFRRWFFVAMALLGVVMVVRALTTM